MIWVTFACVVILAFIAGLLLGKLTIKRAVNYARITGFGDTNNGSSDPRFVEVKGKTYRLIDPDDFVSGANATKICQEVHKEFEAVLTNLQDFIALEKTREAKEKTKEEIKESEPKEEKEKETKA